VGELKKKVEAQNKLGARNKNKNTRLQKDKTKGKGKTNKMQKIK